MAETTLQKYGRTGSTAEMILQNIWGMCQTVRKGTDTSDFSRWYCLIEVAGLDISFVKRLFHNGQPTRDGVHKIYEGTILTSPFETLGEMFMTIINQGSFNFKS